MLVKISMRYKSAVLEIVIDKDKTLFFVYDKYPEVEFGDYKLF